MRTKEELLKFAEDRSRNTMIELLGIKFTDIGEGFIEARMPVDHRTKQPAGLLHGGASAALVETLGSVGTAAFTDLSQFKVSGIEVSAHHLKGVKEGWVTARGKRIHGGKTMQVWNVDIYTDKDELCTSGRITVLILPIRS
jgi:1,4-dihydroxy-2-naphthoyl-CoA hydrolase